MKAFTQASKTQSKLKDAAAASSPALGHLWLAVYQMKTFPSFDANRHSQVSQWLLWLGWSHLMQPSGLCCPHLFLDSLPGLWHSAAAASLVFVLCVCEGRTQSSWPSSAFFTEQESHSGLGQQNLPPSLVLSTRLRFLHPSSPAIQEAPKATSEVLEPSPVDRKVHSCF